MPTAGEKICWRKWRKDTCDVVKCFPDGKGESVCGKRRDLICKLGKYTFDVGKSQLC